MHITNDYFLNENRILMINSGVHDLMGNKPSPHN